MCIHAHFQTSGSHLFRSRTYNTVAHSLSRRLFIYTPLDTIPISSPWAYKHLLHSNTSTFTPHEAPISLLLSKSLPWTPYMNTNNHIPLPSIQRVAVPPMSPCSAPLKKFHLPCNLALGATARCLDTCPPTASQAFDLNSLHNLTTFMIGHPPTPLKHIQETNHGKAGSALDLTSPRIHPDLSSYLDPR